jgi:hypothetical protein
MGEKELWKVGVNQVKFQKLTELVRVHELPPHPNLN